jgi:hypothetical protein
MTTNAQKKKINVVIYHSQQYARPSELAHAPAITVIMNGWIIVRKALPIRVPVATRCLINTSRRAGCELELTGIMGTKFVCKNIAWCHVVTSFHF